MSDKTDLSSFCVIPNAEHWDAYKDQVANRFKCQTFELGFPPQPKSYPCLVASQVRVAADEKHQYRIECCFVYEDDAKLLLSSSVNRWEEHERAVDKMLAEPPWTAGMERPEFADDELVPTIEPDLSILVLAMLKELVGVGAIKTDRLFNELQPMTDKLKAFHKSGVDPDSSVTDFVKDLWEAVGTDAS